MFKFLLIVCIVVSALAAPVKYPTEKQIMAKLKVAGMTQPSIDGVFALNKRFATGYPKVQADKEDAEKFIADHTANVQNFIKAMSRADQTIFNDLMKKYA